VPRHAKWDQVFKQKNSPTPRSKKNAAAIAIEGLKLEISYFLKHHGNVKAIAIKITMYIGFMMCLQIE
jgi:hypothetical protein